MVLVLIYMKSFLFFRACLCLKYVFKICFLKPWPRIVDLENEIRQRQEQEDDENGDELDGLFVRDIKWKKCSERYNKQID